MPSHKDAVLRTKLRNVAWFRPQDIAPDAKLIGFTKSAAIHENQSFEEAGKFTREQLIDGLRIHQSAVLENKWFLNALSMVSSEPHQFARINCLDRDVFTKFADAGLYIFRFVKMSASYYVIIDDMLPCTKVLDGNVLPIFARCENKNLFWVSLIEKAYAKLHTRYFCLSGGSTNEAL